MSLKGRDLLLSDIKEVYLVIRWDDTENKTTELFGDVYTTETGAEELIEDESARDPGWHYNIVTLRVVDQ